MLSCMSCIFLGFRVPHKNNSLPLTSIRQFTFFYQKAPWPRQTWLQCKESESRRWIRCATRVCDWWSRRPRRGRWYSQTRHSWSWRRTSLLCSSSWKCLGRRNASELCHKLSENVQSGFRESFTQSGRSFDSIKFLGIWLMFSIQV